MYFKAQATTLENLIEEVEEGLEELKSALNGHDTYEEQDIEFFPDAPSNLSYSPPVDPDNTLLEAFKDIVTPWDSGWVKPLAKAGEPAGVDSNVPENSILKEALDIVHNDRRADYGPGYPMCKKIAEMWSVIFGDRVQPEHVPMAMIAFKLVRQMYKHKRDNIVDMAGYAELLGEVMDQRPPALW